MSKEAEEIREFHRYLEELKVELGEELFMFAMEKKLPPETLETMMHLRFLFARFKEIEPGLWEEFTSSHAPDWWDWLNSRVPDRLAQWEKQWEAFFALFLEQIREGNEGWRRRNNE